MSFGSDYSLILVSGVEVGSVYAIAAMGLVLTYKTSGLFNFGQGAVAAAAAYVFYGFYSPLEAGWAWPFAALVSVVVFGPVVGLLLELVARGLADVPITYKIVGTVGLLLIFRQVGIIWFDNDSSLPLNVYLPKGAAFSIDGTVVTKDQLITVLLALALAVALFAFFRFSRTGTAMRAVVDDPALIDMTGHDPVRVRRVAWIIGTTFAALSGILIAPQQSAVDGSLLTILVVYAFGAAVFGYFRSLPLAYVGGITVGLIQNWVNHETNVRSSLQSFSQLGPNAPFLVLFIGLLVVPKRKLTDIGRQVKAKASTPSRLPLPARSAINVGMFALLALVPVVGSPLVGDTKLVYWSEAMSSVVLFLSLGLLVRTSGQVSLCQIGLAAVGGCVFSKMVAEQHLPWAVGVLLAGLLTVPVGAIIAIPAIRLSGLYLGLATLGFGALLAQVFYLQTWMFGPANGIPFPRPSGFSGDKGYYYVLLAFVALSAALVAVVERSRLGRLLRGLADSPTALTVHGASVATTRVIVFCISAFLAGVSGALFGGIFQRVDQNSFNFFNSLILLAIMAITAAFFRTLPAAIIAAIAYQVLGGYISSHRFNEVLPLIFGIGALLAALLSQGSRVSAFFDRRAEVSAWRSNSPAAARRRTLAPARGET
ncbi:MAG TPA: ABC transporter permease [Mycobacteriales bacterium]|nr:ABC transporter permease [Mycobacteriales bacterium]